MLSCYLRIWSKRLVIMSENENNNQDNIPVEPKLSVFLSSLRDIGYSFETALADLIDNSISANAKNIKILALPSTDKLVVLDDGSGMSDKLLLEAMRLGTQKETRAKNDLGRFGLGLKTASFSQCRKLTVFSKDSESIAGYTWDLDFLSKENKWLLQKASVADLKAKLDKNTNQDFLVSRGEYITAKLMSEYLGYTFVDAKDSFRHSKWLSYIQKRLNIAHKLLSKKGVIFNNFVFIILSEK